MVNYLKRPKNMINLLVLCALALAGCSVVSSPPRLSTTRVPVNSGQTEELFLPAPTPTGQALSLPNRDGQSTDASLNPILTVWVNETSAEHQVVLEQMTRALDANYGLHMEFVLVDPDRLVDLVEGAALVNQLPDVIIHPIEYSAGWATRGILDQTLSSSIIEELGHETFNQSVINTALVNGANSAIPVDGYKQLLLYRSDWFDDLNLSAPTDYRSILQGARQIYRSETLSAQNGITNTLLSGLVIPTESDLISTHQVFEHFASANECDLIAEDGEVTILTPECMDTFEFYRELINQYSPSDIQTDTSAINAFLAGRTGMIVGSPDFLLDVAGLAAERTPSCPECLEDPNFLAQNSGVQVGLSGRSRQREPVEFGHITLMGFTTGTQPELAQSFAEYWFNDGYELWLGIEPARRVPMRQGTQSDPQQFLELWASLPLSADGRTVTDIYGADVAEKLANNLSAKSRWGIASGQGDLISDVYSQNVVSIVLQEMLSGYFTSSQAIIAAWERVIELIPGYRFETEIPNFIPSNDSG